MKKIILTAAAFMVAVSVFAEVPSDTFGMQPPQDGFGTVPDEKAPELKAALEVNMASNGKTLRAETLRSTKADESVLVIKDGAKAQALKTIFEKALGDVTNSGQSNFYGLNAAVVAQGGSTLILQNVTVTTDANGANAVFSTGDGSVVSIKNIKIHTKKDSSRGLDATYGGMITADNVDITTEGAHCAAFATDRGEGTLSINKGSARTNGEGSPIIYSTGDISVHNLTGIATGSEIAVIEGKNSITVEKSTLTGGTNRARGNEVNAAIMLYQSMSGDAHRGTSVFTASDSTLTSMASGAFFYVTNTNATIALNRVKIVHPNDVLLLVSGNESERGWGRKGANGGTLSVAATNQMLGGNIVTDAISSVSLTFGNGTKYSGAINAANSGCVNLNLAKKATISLTADSYVNALDLEDSSYRNIKSNGHTLFYNKDEKANSYLHGRTVLLPDGGKLCGISMKTALKDGKPGMKNGKPEMEVGKQKMKDGKPEMKAGMKNMNTISVTGVISVANDTVTLTANDGTIYTLSVMTPPAPQDSFMQPPAGGMGGKPPAGFGDSDGNHPAGKQPDKNPPAGNPPAENPPAGKQGKEPPKHLSLDDLKVLAGKTVEIKGIMLQEKLMTMQVTEK